ncbi:galactokinase [Chloroflexi bacterium TSY]|nr:galactokinase [Chloroflexi bacterium TSY]
MEQLYDSLASIYGDNAQQQFSRYREAISAFYAQYGAGEIFVFRAPGRVNLIGEHTDYNHGYVLPVALDKDVVLLARPRQDQTIRLHNVEATYSPVEFRIDSEIPRASTGDWSNYVRGAAQVLAQHLDRPVTGLDILVAGSAPFGVPKGAGLSSSTALTVVTAMALAYFARFQPTAAKMAHLCSDAEWYVGTRGGLMDQFASLLGQCNHALFLDCRPAEGNRFQTEQIPLPQGYSVLIVDSGVHHRNVRGEFNQRVAACRAGVSYLQKAYPNITHLRDVEAISWSELEPHLPEVTTASELQRNGIDLGEIPGLDLNAALKIRARCRHVWSENRRVLQAIEAMHQNDVGKFGQFMNKAHESARDDYEISCPELEVLVNVARDVDGVVGARLTGAGWGGCMVALVQTDAVPTFQQHVETTYQKQTNRQAMIFGCQSADGAGVVSIVQGERVKKT